MKQLQCVVIGCGAIGPIHMEAIVACDAANLYGVCDILPERAQRYSQQYRCKAFSSIEEVLSDPAVDSVHICTPHYLHVPMALAAAKAEKRIVLEKPIAMNTKDAAIVAQALENIPCCAIFQNRYNPCVKRMKHAVDKHTYGELLGLKGILTWCRTPQYYQSADWRGKWATEGGGLVINQAVHMLDLLQFLGGGAAAIQAHYDTRVLGDVIEVEDTAEATLYLHSGKLAHFYAINTYSTNSPYDIELHFERGILRYMYGKLYLVSGDALQLLESDDNAGKGKVYWGAGHAYVINAFYQGTDYTTISDALASISLVEGLYRSSRENKKIFL